MIAYLISLIGSAALLGCATQVLRELLSIRRFPWLPLAISLLSLVPAGDLTLGRVIHSFTGYISIPLMALLIWYLCSPLVGNNWIRSTTITRYRWLILLTATFYFPSAMGVGNWDMHSFGWSPSFVWLPIGLTTLMIWMGDWKLATIFSVATLAWQGQWMGIDNGWNYLIDPIAAVFSCVGIATQAFVKLTSRSEQLMGEPSLP